jgi:hypothetical protein
MCTQVKDYCAWRAAGDALLPQAALLAQVPPLP